MYLPELRLKYTHKHQTDNSLVALVAFSLEHVDYILKQRQVGANMVFARILGRVFGCWRRKGKSLQGSIQSHDRKVAANETLSDSESQSVYSVYLIDPVSAVSEASESIAFDDCWSYAVSVELSLNTEECCIAADTATCMDSVLLSANLGNVSSDLEDAPELFQASDGRILFAI